MKLTSVANLLYNNKASSPGILSADYTIGVCAPGKPEGIGPYYTSLPLQEPIHIISKRISLLNPLGASTSVVQTVSASWVRSHVATSAVRVPSTPTFTYLPSSKSISITIYMFTSNSYSVAPVSTVIHYPFSSSSSALSSVSSTDFPSILLITVFYLCLGPTAWVDPSMSDSWPAHS